jgi:endonuclease YncB( thermonuclease family)
MKRLLTLLTLLLLTTSFCDKEAQQTARAEVTYITDGDTFECTMSGEEVTIRLYGVDCPEADQPYGDEAEEWLRNAIGGETVSIERIEEGYYGRTIAIVKFNGKNINGALVKNGLAWVSDRYCDREALCDRWRNFQQQARDGDVGLWSQPNPVPPWDYRD